MEEMVTIDLQPVPSSSSDSFSTIQYEDIITSKASTFSQSAGFGNNIGSVAGNLRKVIPGRTRAGETRCLEPGCSFRCSRIPQLRNHLQTHGIKQELLDFRFSTEEDFKQWLGSLESEAKCTYMRRRGWQTNKNGSETACFYCHRGGAYTSKASKKQTKLQGSCKTGVECTSSMKVIMWPTSVQDGRTQRLVEVEAYLQHYGHNIDLEHTRIPKKEKSEIAKRLSTGISRSKILDEIRETLEPSASPNRLHLVSLQDLYNIEKKANLKTRGQKCGSDPGTTVQAWIEKMQSTEDNPVLLIKYQQERPTKVCSCLTEDDFILVMQTSLQANMLRRHGHGSFLCIDMTQGDVQSAALKGDPSFYLVTLEVVVANPCGTDDVAPVAWFVSNRKDRQVISIFLTQIKQNLSDITLAPAYLFLPSPGLTGFSDWYEIWTTVFQTSPQKLLCTWHVFEDWKRQTVAPSSKVRSTPMESTRLLANLITVQQEASMPTFLQLLDEFLDDLRSSEATQGLAAYFHRTFAYQPAAWSRAYRPDEAFAAERRFDEFHRTLAKNIYHEGFKRKQLDVLVKTLLKYSRDKTLGKLRTMYKQTNAVMLRRRTQAKHDVSRELSTTHVTPQSDGKSWNVLTLVETVERSEADVSGQPVRVKQMVIGQRVSYRDERCTARLNCSYRCDECGVCSHQLVCTCSHHDDQCGVMCEHCHLVSRYVRENGSELATLSGTIVLRSSARAATPAPVTADVTSRPPIDATPDIAAASSYVTTTPEPIGDDGENGKIIICVLTDPASEKLQTADGLNVDANGSQM